MREGCRTTYAGVAVAHFSKKSCYESTLTVHTGVEDEHERLGTAPEICEGAFKRRNERAGAAARGDGARSGAAGVAGCRTGGRRDAGGVPGADAACEGVVASHGAGGVAVQDDDVCGVGREEAATTEGVA